MKITWRYWNLLEHQSDMDYKMFFPFPTICFIWNKKEKGISFYLFNWTLDLVIGRKAKK